MTDIKITPKRLEILRECRGFKKDNGRSVTIRFLEQNNLIAYVNRSVKNKPECGWVLTDRGAKLLREHESELKIEMVKVYPEVSKEPLQSFFGIFRHFNAFKIGGDPWQTMKFKLSGHKIYIQPYDCFIVFFAKQYMIYEKESGGLLGHGETEKEAIDCTIKNIRETDDLADQIKQSGKAEGHPEMLSSKVESMMIKNKE